jgi:hypothetical protein
MFIIIEKLSNFVLRPHALAARLEGGFKCKGDAFSEKKESRKRMITEAPAPSPKTPQELRQPEGDAFSEEKESRKCMLTEAPAPPPKVPKSFGSLAFEGEDDTFLRERTKETHAHRSLSIAPKNSEVPIPMCEGEAFGRISLH